MDIQEETKARNSTINRLRRQTIHSIRDK